MDLIRTVSTIIPGVLATINIFKGSEDQQRTQQGTVTNVHLFKIHVGYGE